MTKRQMKVILMAYDGTVKQILERYKDHIEEGYRGSIHKKCAIMIIDDNGVVYGGKVLGKKLIKKLNRIVNKKQVMRD